MSEKSFFSKEIRIAKLKNRISLLESRGEYNRNIVNSLKRELRNIISN